LARTCWTGRHAAGVDVSDVVGCSGCKMIVVATAAAGTIVVVKVRFVGMLLFLVRSKVVFPGVRALAVPARECVRFVRPFVFATRGRIFEPFLAVRFPARKGALVTVGALMFLAVWQTGTDLSAARLWAAISSGTIWHGNHIEYARNFFVLSTISRTP